MGLGHRHPFPVDFTLVLPEDMTLEEPNKKNSKFLLTNMISLKQGRGGSLPMEEYAAPRKTADKQKAAGNSKKPMSLKDNASWGEMACSADLLLSPREQSTGNETGVSVAIWGHFLAPCIDFDVLESHEAVWPLCSNMLENIVTCGCNIFIAGSKDQMSYCWI